MISDFFSGLFCLNSVCFLYIYGCVFPKLGQVFFYNVVEDIVYTINMGFFSLICTYNSMVWSIWGVPHFLYASCLDLLFYSTDTHAYFCYNTMLVMLLWLCDLPWDKICWYFKLYSFFPWGLLWLPRVFCTYRWISRFYFKCKE